MGSASADDGITTFVIGIGIDDYLDDSASCTLATDCPDIFSDLNCTAGQCSYFPFAPQGINPRVELDKVAVAGGAPSPITGGFYAADNQADLQAALAQIAGAIPSCTLPLNPAPVAIQVNFVTVTVDGVEYPTPLDGPEECETTDGWYWSNEFDEITVCGTACDSVKATGSLDAEYGCPVG